VKKYNHLYAMAFSVNTDRDKDAPVDVNEILAAIYRRVADVTEHKEWNEAICPPLETVENQEGYEVGIVARAQERELDRALAHTEALLKKPEDQS